MNKERRAQLDEAYKLLAEAQAIISEVAGAERDAFDGMPEGLQQGERGSRMDEVASELEDIESTIDEVMSIVDGAKASPAAG